jgi:hypothetical protein
MESYLQLGEVFGGNGDRAVGRLFPGGDAGTGAGEIEMPRTGARDVHLKLGVDRLGFVGVALKNTGKLFVEDIGDVDGHGLSLDRIPPIH